ncbi:DUF2690 domain-containing protein [Streptomyces sp. V3I7]|uniref:DUF2690 domain-containing protein n=1 Tax=Streptomyces sp. V3I7 TaxID=3042278 RepID=UPI002781C305|nr:DUF2690 domain-containing protein [Streptomyces sp. V3I7]MDQ0994780.1 hypothetical protein [Streptomyces sp. V3I7]
MGQFGTGGERDETARDGSVEPAEPAPELVDLLSLIRRYMAELGWSYNVMGRRTTASASTWNRWATQGRLPRRDALTSFADAAPRTVDRAELLSLWDAAWAAQQQVPELAEEQPHPTPAGAQGAPAQGSRRSTARKTVPLVSGLVGAAVAGGVFLFWAINANANDPSGAQAAPPAASASPAVEPTPTVSCHGTACATLDPAHSICAKDAVTAYIGKKYGAVIELRYSSRCAAAWAKMSHTSAGDRVTITPRHGDAEEYRQQYGHDAHTSMVAAGTPGDARACAIIQDRGTICATKPATPHTATPS